MKVIGITGGVGAGKSEVISYIKNNTNSIIIMADNVAHDLEKKGMPAYIKLVELLGDEILDEDGEINKLKFANAIFIDSTGEILSKVNGIIHPIVKDYILNVIDTERNRNIFDYLFIEAALLIEDGYDKICDELWYIYASEETRRIRLKESRGYSDEKISGIFKKQNSEDVFRKYCIKEINNDGSIENMQQSVNKLLKL